MSNPKRLERLKEIGLIGCLNDSGVTSQNYKEVLKEMPKYRMTYCQDSGFSKGMWLFGPIDLRKKYYFCNHCQKKHLVKEGLKKNDR